MTRTKAIIAALIMPIFLILFAPAPSAQAVTCFPGTNVCQGGDVRHAADPGYDPAIIVFCNYGDAFPTVNWNRDRRVAEGTSSHADCGDDTDVIYIRAGEELWCDAGYHGDYLALDSTGPHKINDLFDRRCELRRD